MSAPAPRPGSPDTPGGWPEEELSVLIATLEMAYRDYRHDPKTLLTLFFGPVVNRAKKYGPPPPVLRQWLTEKFKDIQGYHHQKAEFWSRVVLYYGLPGQINPPSHAVETSTTHQVTQSSARSEEPSAPRKVQADPETVRLAVALHRTSPVRLWLVSLDMVRAKVDGTTSNSVTRKALFKALAAYGIRMTRRSFNGILQRGLGVFFSAFHDDWIYFKGQKNAAQALVEKALADHRPELVRYDRPGVRQWEISVDGSLQQFEAHTYAAWLAANNNPTIARETLCAVWDREKKALLAWERRLGDGLQIQENHAQTVTVDSENAPDHAYAVTLQISAGQSVTGLGWQRPNTYHVKMPILQRPAKGQARKIRQAVNAVCEHHQPADTGPAAHPYGVRNFTPRSDESAWKRYERAMRKPDRPIMQDYVYLGERGRRTFSGVRAAVWERMNSPTQDHCHTNNDSYIDLKRRVALREVL